MKRFAVSVPLMLALMLPAPALAAHRGIFHRTSTKLIGGLGPIHHPVSTENPLAQKFFDQGLALIWGFNHEEAARSFQRAAQLDPDLAMAHWGIALALGPNYNLDVDPQRERQAYDEIQKARRLEWNASENERAYIEALARRYSSGRSPDYKLLARNYHTAMGETARQFPDDLDAATLYAEAGMDLNPWRLWHADGTPAEGTREIVDTLQSVLERDPNHVGANHLYIHAVEASPHPERGLEAADRLRKLVTNAGHLMHMPSHIYFRTGDYEDSAEVNAAAVAVDRNYIRTNHVDGVYPMMYYSHNLQFLVMSYSMEGRYRDTEREARRLEEHLRPYQNDHSMPPDAAAQMNTVAELALLMEVRFDRWQEVLERGRPQPQSPLTDALWNYGRAMAYAATGDIEQAGAERDAMLAAMKEIPVDSLFGFDKTADVLEVPLHTLQGRIAMARHNYETAIGELRKAVAAEDKLSYSEPPTWYYPVRETLGGALLQTAQYEQAEEVFREDLRRNPNNPRSLFGLRESLHGQHRDEDAAMVGSQFKNAWRKADTELRFEDL